MTKLTDEELAQLIEDNGVGWGGAKAAERLRELSAENERLRAENIKIRAYAARAQHVSENEEYPYSKAELRQNLRKACNSLNAIATSKALSNPALECAQATTKSRKALSGEGER